MKKLLVFGVMLCALTLAPLKAQEPYWNRMDVRFDGDSNFSVYGEFVDLASQILPGSGAGIVVAGTLVWSYLVPPFQSQIAIQVDTQIYLDSSEDIVWINGSQYIHVQFVYESIYSGVVYRDEYMPIGYPTSLYF